MLSTTGPPAEEDPLVNPDGLSLWIGALLTLMIFSFLYKDNPFYKFAEHLFVGVSAAYWMVQAFWKQIMPNLMAKLFPRAFEGIIEAARGQAPDYAYVVPLVLGIILLMRLVGPISWISRWAVAFVIGYTAGSNLPRYLGSDFITQVHATMDRSWIAVGDNWLQTVMYTISSVVVVGGVVCGLIYFFFSKEHTGAFGKASRAGIYVLMIAFGASFGYTVMARVSLLIGRLEYLGQWIRSIVS